MAESNTPSVPLDAAVLLVNPKTPYNVGSVIRACSIFDVPWLRWTGSRIATAEGRRKAGSWAKGNKPRLPREERLQDYLGVDWREDENALRDFIAEGLIPVAVEIVDGAESLPDFIHPERAVYVFGPEDGSVPKGTRHACHRFLRIPSASRTPLNLAAAVNLVLYDRFVKLGAVAQQVEHLSEEQGVAGSIPARTTLVGVA